jgi:hypothetical protein
MNEKQKDYKSILDSLDTVKSHLHRIADSTPPESRAHQAARNCLEVLTDAYQWLEETKEHMDATIGEW